MTETVVYSVSWHYERNGIAFKQSLLDQVVTSAMPLKRFDSTRNVPCNRLGHSQYLRALHDVSCMYKNSNEMEEGHLTANASYTVKQKCVNENVRAGRNSCLWGCEICLWPHFLKTCMPISFFSASHLSG